MTDIMPASLLLRERNMEDIDRMLSSFSITFALSSGLYRPFFLVCVAIHASSCVDYFEFSFIGC
ncbi:hypothetical protein NC653_037373 [Populus alba x Populus x berolinensis]|uniref:Uncharacterized protein n=1 Tax=Populus alba x Populus x berolinensis TaxID=444605 RepID=A0AAD6LFV0_9ROSI|nr:hypothetical protein NC653_037373 [Populus alba x Populus x berolinensis]